MIIAISGIPGTGKSEVAKLLAKKLNANLIDIKQLIKKHKVPYKTDKKRKTKIVNPRDLQKSVKKSLTKGDNIIEGILAHLLKANIVIVLRSNPHVLEKRLKKRKWSKAKIKENIQAEILDEIVIEALEKHSKVYEIDTSKKSAKNTTEIIEKIVNKKGVKYRAGRIDWSEKYKNYLLK